MIGDISNVHVFSVNHQDPDVGTNGVYIQKMNPNSVCITTEDVWRLAQHAGFNQKSVKILHPAKDKSIQFKSGHKLYVVPTPFLHFKGAFALYDPETEIIYTGDFFAGLSQKKSYQRLYAEEDSWNGIAGFHQIYMPSNQALQYSVEKLASIKKLSMIAPQHGDIIQKNLIPSFIDLMRELKVGLDLLTVKKDKKLLLYQGVLDELMKQIKDDCNCDHFFKTLSSEEILNEQIKIENGHIELLKEPMEALDIVVNILIREEESKPLHNKIKRSVIKACVDRNIMPISLNWEDDEEESITNLDFVDIN